MAMGSMLCVQVGLAIAVTLIDRIGVEGAALAAAGVGRDSAAAHRPAPSVRRSRGPASRCASCSASSRRRSRCCSWRRWTGFRWAPPARWSSSGRSASRWRTARARSGLSGRGCAALGVVLLTEPWAGVVDPIGVLFALGAAACWATYILLTQRVGDQVAGINGLAVSMPVAGAGGHDHRRPRGVRPDDPRDSADRHRPGDPAAGGAVRAGAPGVAPA